jgi:hypothetical protein
MTRRSVAVAVLFLFVAVGGVFAFNEPNGFRGMPWGASESDTVKAIGRTPAWLGCTDNPAVDRVMGDRSCIDRTPIGSVEISAVYSFRSDRLVRVELQFATGDFARLSAIFIERYGRPTSRRQDALEWSGTSASVFLGSRGYAAIATQAEIRESKRLRDEQTKGAAKGL